MKLNYIGTPVGKYLPQEFSTFLDWFIPQKLLGHDIESNVTASILDRVLITVQFADKETAWVLQWSYLTPEQQQTIIKLMNESHRKMIIHSATFEYTLWLNYGVRLKNIWDTYTCEQILNTGKAAEEGAYNLESVIFKRFGITLDKSMQLQFGDDIMTEAKIEYAAMDVAKSVELYEMQKSEAKDFDKSFPQKHHKGLVKTMWWDNEFKLVAGDLEYNGPLLDQEKWKACCEKYQPLMQEAKTKLDSIVIRDFKDFAIQEGWYSDEDRFESIWGSSEKKKEMLQLVFPNIEGTTKLALKKYLRDNDPDFPTKIIQCTLEDNSDPQEYIDKKVPIKITGKEWENHDYPYDLLGKYSIIKALISCKKDIEEGVYLKLNRFFYQNFPEFMLERGYVIPAKTLSLNWASPQQRLKLFQHINPKIEDTTALTVENNLLTHELFPAYDELSEYLTLVTKYGLDYLKHVHADGRIRTVYNTVLATGRLSAKEPNLLGIPKNNDYRACFVAPEGFKLIDADFDGQELCVIATLSKEPVWLHHLQQGHDLHSVNAEVVLETEWKDAAEEDCAYYKDHQKCKCKKHREQRGYIKSIDFGLSYGLSAYGLAARQHKTEEEAEATINKFFTSFPKVKSFLSSRSQFGVNKGFIYNASFGRVRFFDKWKIAKKQDYYGNWVYANPEKMREVARAAANFPIQSEGADILKVALVLLKRFIDNNNLRNDIQIVIPYHDEAILYARDGYEQLAKEKLEYYMKLSGKLLLKNDLLRAEAKISNYWIKD